MLREVGAEPAALEDGMRTYRLALPEVLPDEPSEELALYRIFRLAAKRSGGDLPAAARRGA